MPVTKIYGTRDGIASYDAMLGNKRLLPSTTRGVGIEGGTTCNLPTIATNWVMIPLRFRARTNSEQQDVPVQRARGKQEVSGRAAEAALSSATGASG